MPPSIARSKFRNLSVSQLRRKQEVEVLLKKYGGVRIPGEPLKREERRQDGIRNDLEANVIQVRAKKEQRQQAEEHYQSEKLSKHSKTALIQSSEVKNGKQQDSGLDYGLAMAAADYVGKVLARDEPESQDERELIIRQTFLRNMANDFKLKGREENEPCFGKIRIIIRHKKPEETKKVVKAPKPKAPTPVKMQQLQTTSNKISTQYVTQTKKKTTQVVTVKSEVIKMPTIKTTTVVRVRKV